MDHSDTNNPPDRRSGTRIFEVLVAVALFGGWIALQTWILPSMGVRT